jgi:hypothetical protein
MEARTQGRSASRSTPCASHCSSWSASPGLVIAAALLHPEIGAADRRRAGALLLAGEPEEVLEEVPMGTNAEVPLAHRLQRSHLLEAVWVEVLELQSVREQHPADEPADGDGEVALVEGHE